MIPTLRRIFLLSLLAGGCARKSAPAVPNPCAASAPSLVELHGGDGVLQLALRPAAGGGAVVCDPEEHIVATLTAGDKLPGLVLRSPAGAVRAALVAGDEVSMTLGEKRLRLHDQNDLLRVLDANGVPLGQIGQQGERAIAFDPAGRPLATAERADPGEERRVIRAPDGAVRNFILGLHDDRAAAAFALPALEPPDQLVLARYLDGKRPPKDEKKVERRDEKKDEKK